MDDPDVAEPQIDVQPVDCQDANHAEGLGDEKEEMLAQYPGPERRNSDPGIKPSPVATAGLFSKYVSFWWLNPLLALGKKKPLEATDFYGLCKADTTEELGERLQTEWDKEQYQAQNKGQKPSLGKALFRTFGKGYILLGIFALIIDSLRIIQPLLLGQLISYFAKESTMEKTHAFLFALGVSLCSFFATFCNVPFAFLRQRCGMQLRIACTSLVYRKTLRLSNAALAQTTTGNIVNLVSSDTQKFDFACFFLHYLVLGPLEAVVVLILLYLQIGIASVAGMGVLLLLVPAQIKMGRVLMKVRRCAAKWIDERVKVMNEVISGMRVIKMYTWEDSFTEWIDKIRKTELKWFKKLQYIRGIFMSFFFTSAPLISFVTFMTYVLTGNVLTAQKVFTAVSLFNSVRMVMSLFFPLAITLMNEGRVSIERIQKLLNLNEMQSEGLITSKLRPKPDHCGIIADKISASWKEDLPKPTLKDISFELAQGELLGIIGPVGSGKSSMLMAILGELPLSEGTITVRGKVGYASQQAWIYNGSLQQNIIFGSEYNESKYQEVIKACALERDIELLPEGDMTLVGERGVSLSGGQKARVNLARAVYSDSDVYILDDPLSAVDANVGRHLFDKCICGYLAHKPRILVTHQLQYLKEVDELIVLSEGECIGQGTYQELSKTNVDFMSLLIEEEDDDSAIESDSESSGARTKRQISRQFSRQFSRQSSLTTGRLRSDSHRASCYKHSELFDSTVSVTSAVTDMSIYEENILPKETKQEGAVTLDTYLQYFRALKSLGIALFVFFLFLLSQVVFLLNDWWLSYWSNREEVYGIQQKAFNKFNASVPNATEPVVEEVERHVFLSIYAALVIGLIVLVITRTELFFTLSIAASRKFHQRMFSCVVRAPSYFFDTNSIGRILNRFSKDLGFIDDMMPFTVCDFIQTFTVVLGILCLVAANNPITFVVVIPVVILFWWLRQHYMSSSREIKRIEGITRSPLFGHFSTTLLGLDTIRAFGVEETFLDQVNLYQDAHTRAWFTFIATQAWLSYRLEILCVIFISFTSLISPALRDSLSAGVVGLTLSYATNLTGVFNQCVKQSAEMENLMTSVERVLEYCKLESEAPPETDVKPPKNWPPKGQIKMDNMSFSYHRSLPRVLHHISCCIEPREKVGVVGRTGAGKSSLLSTLFRLAEPTGLIEIDGVNIMELGLKDLRGKLSIIPQDPVLFSGTMRRNIDPFNKHEDVELWTVLDEVQLKSAVEDLPGKMDTELAESGSNFSVGQRQLVCLARAILRHSRILVIDEATANVDPRTDSLIQATIREKFKKCTVLTIAHRLHTIMDSDRVMVLDAGRLKEFDVPYKLLKNPRSLFSKLVSQTGPEEARRLYETARTAYYKDKSIPEDEPDAGPEPQAEVNTSPPEMLVVVPDEKARLIQYESTI